MNGNQQEFNVKEIAGEEPKKLGGKFKFQKRHLKIGLGIIIVLILVFTTITFLKGWFSFSKSNVDLEIISSVEVSSGEEIEFAIRYQNNNRVALKDVRLIMDYPQGVYSLEGEELTQEVKELGTIPSKKGGTENFKIRLTGEKGSIKLLSARLSYQPTNINSHFENLASFQMNISSVLIGAYLTAPQKAINGEEIAYIFDYINDSNQDFSNVKVELNYPSGFTYKTAEPLPLENNIWQIEELKQGERGTIRISGILEGIEGENKTLGVSIGEIKNDKFLKYSQTTAVIQISSSPLIITLSLNDREEEVNVDAKDVLNYKIEFKNNTDIALSQLILKAYLRGEMFNFRSVKLAQKGFFDSLNNVITWSAAGVPSLALLPPGESGSINFSIAVNENFPINDFNDKNFQISVQAELETLNVPPQFSLARLKVEKILKSKINSRVVLRTKGYYNETAANITNFGPIPPKVNQVTTYTIHWQITNTSNDLENVRVTAILPEGIEWRNVYTTLNKDTKLEYNERTKQIAWNIDKIPAATGFLIPAYELVFQIALRPSITQVGTSPVLIDESRLEGKDTFTGEAPEAFSPALATGLPDDLTVTAKLGEVVE